MRFQKWVFLSLNENETTTEKQSQQRSQRPTPSIAVVGQIRSQVKSIFT